MRWLRLNNNLLVGELGQIKGSDFEAVDASSLTVDPNSGLVDESRIPPAPPKNLQVGPTLP
jgi:hypothetical protein